MKNLEEKMNNLFQTTSSAKDSQIKGELQLKDLNEAVNFIQNVWRVWERKKRKRRSNLELGRKHISIE